MFIRVEGGAQGPGACGTLLLAKDKAAVVNPIVQRGTARPRGQTCPRPQSQHWDLSPDL